MLDDFIGKNRETIIHRAQDRVRSRTCPVPSEVELEHGIPMFLDQLRSALWKASSGNRLDNAEIHRSAQIHGSDLQKMGLTIGQVVHDYGDVCQVVTALAVEQGAPIPARDFQTLNLCLDDAIASAVTEFSHQREAAVANAGTEKLGMLAHELRNLLNTAMLAFDSIRRGHASPNGRTAADHDRALNGLRALIERSLAEVRLDAGIDRQERIPVAELLEEIEIGGVIQARARNLRFSVTSDDPELAVIGDRHILAAAVANLLQNAFKFTPTDGHVSLHVHATSDTVQFNVADACGGLPPGKAEELFRPFAQRGSDRTGVGLGLSIVQKAAAASHGDVRVRDLPGEGCIFTLELPRPAG